MDLEASRCASRRDYHVRVRSSGNSPAMPANSHATGPRSSSTERPTHFAKGRRPRSSGCDHAPELSHHSSSCPKRRSRQTDSIGSASPTSKAPAWCRRLQQRALEQRVSEGRKKCQHSNIAAEILSEIIAFCMCSWLRCNSRPLCSSES